MPTTATPDRKEMRKTAKKLGIPDWEGMTEKQLASAIKKFKKTEGDAPAKTKAKTNGKGKVTKTPRGQTKADKGEPVTPTEKAKAAKSKDKVTKESKKAKKPAKKTAPKTAAKGVEPAANGNPFRPGSNAFKHTELLIKGGSRASIITKLLKSIEFHPWGGKKAAKKIDPVKTMDKRLLMTTHQLQHLYGFTIVIWGGRGPEKSSIQVFPPSATVPAALTAKATLINGSKPGASKAKTKPVAAKKTRAKTGTSKPKAAKKSTTKAKAKTKAKK